MFLQRRITSCKAPFIVSVFKIIFLILFKECFCFGKIFCSILRYQSLLILRFLYINKGNITCHQTVIGTKSIVLIDIPSCVIIFPNIVQSDCVPPAPCKGVARLAACIGCFSGIFARGSNNRILARLTYKQRQSLGAFFLA